MRQRLLASSFFIGVTWLTLVLGFQNCGKNTFFNGTTEGEQGEKPLVSVQEEQLPPNTPPPELEGIPTQPEAEDQNHLGQNMGVACSAGASMSLDDLAQSPANLAQLTDVALNNVDGPKSYDSVRALSINNFRGSLAVKRAETASLHNVRALFGSLAVGAKNVDEISDVRLGAVGVRA